MKRLPSDVQFAIMEALAAEKLPLAIVREIKARFGLNVSHQHVATFYPCRGARLPTALVERYAEARARFVVEQSGEPRLYRRILLRELDRAATVAERRGHYAEALRYVERSFVEIGRCAVEVGRG